MRPEVPRRQGRSLVIRKEVNEMCWPTENEDEHELELIRRLQETSPDPRPSRPREWLDLEALRSLVARNFDGRPRDG